MIPAFASISDLTFIYGDGTLALENVSIEISKGERIGLIGENGSGKTTLCKHLNGLLSPNKGSVEIEGRKLKDLSISAVSGKVGFLFQNPDNQLFCGKVSEEVSFGLRNLGLEGKALEDRTKKYLQLLGLEKYADSPPLMLSLGLRRLVTIASVLAMEQDLIILDEPTAWLDKDQTDLAVRAIMEFSASGKSIIVVSHNMKLIAQLTKRTIMLSHGKKIADGLTRTILANTDLLIEVGLAPTPVAEFASSIELKKSQLIITEDDLIEVMLTERQGGGSKRS